MKNTPALEELPLRAQCGYVIKYGTVKQGELTPGVIAGILHAKGVLEDDADLDEVRRVAGEVLDNNPETND